MVFRVFEVAGLVVFAVVVVVVLSGLMLLMEGKRGKRSSAYIMIFQLSTGSSASLKDQSKRSPASGSSVGSW